MSKSFLSRLWSKRVKHPAIRRAAGAVVQTLESRQFLDAVIDVRLANDGGQSATISQNGQVIQMEVWATITGGNDDGSDDGLQILSGSFLSSNRNGGAVKGTLKATPDGNYSNLGASAGASADLDNDGDSDVGSNNNGDVEGFFAVRAVFDPRNGGIVDGASHSFKIATVTFTATQLLPGEATRIVFRPRNSTQNTAGLWVEDNQVKTNNNADLRSGTHVSLTLADGVNPDPDPKPTDTAPPTAALDADKLTTGGGSNYTFKVNYSDNNQVKASTLGTGDVRVTGPNGFNQVATFVSSQKGADGSVTGTYRINAPGGSWDQSDNGAYSVNLQAKQVTDAAGNAAVAKKLGEFAVSVGPASLKDGVLSVTTGSGNDSIALALVKGTVRVTVNRAVSNFDAGKVNRINISSGGGNDAVTIDAGNVASRVDAGTGNDSLTGGNGRDTLEGGGGDDRLLGGNNNDLILAGSGNDVIDGQGGNDKFDGGSGNDKLNGGSGNDTADYGSRAAALKISLDGKSNDGQTGETDNVASDVEQILGGKANDLLTGNGSNNVLVGGAGNDTIRGGSGNDTLTGGPGSDQLFGDNNDDRLEARDGSIDTVNGGSGRDSARVDGNDRRTAVEQVLA